MHYRRYLAVAIFFWAGLTHCSEELPTTNPVQTVDLATLEGITSDEGFRGLVVVMASWCPPCRKELPIVSELYEKYKTQGIQIVALSVDAEGPNAVQPLINELKVPFPVYWVGTSALQRYRISGIPTLMVYDKGKLLEMLPGSHPRKAIENIIGVLLGRAG